MAGDLGPCQPLLAAGGILAVGLGRDHRPFLDEGHRRSGVVIEDVVVKRGARRESELREISARLRESNQGSPSHLRVRS
jgi:hypothetical protein